MLEENTLCLHGVDMGGLAHLTGPTGEIREATSRILGLAHLSGPEKTLNINEYVKIQSFDRERRSQESEPG